MLQNVHAQEIEYIPADSSFADAEENDETEMADIPDTTLLKHHEAAFPGMMDSLKAKKEFAYMSVMDSLLKARQNAQVNEQRTTKRSLSFLDRLFNTPFLKIMFWLLVAFVILFIIFRLVNTPGIFQKRTAGSNTRENEDNEAVYTQSDYSKLILQSCRLADYRLAVKYLFLSTLQQLADRSLIEYALDKTNYRYLQEVPADKKEEFSRLILNYEYTWYGNMHIGRESYERIESEFTAFRQKI